MTETYQGREIVYQPQPGFQMAVHRRLEDIVTIGGTKGPGKTQALIGESLRDIGHPKYHGIFFRRVFPSLQEIIDRAHDIFPKLGGKWKGDLSRYEFPSGAKIDFSHLQNEEDKRRHQGKEYTKQFWDQLEEFTETQFDYVTAQNRTSAEGLRCAIYASHNPGGPGNGWINRRFVKGKESGKTYRESAILPDGRTVTRTICFVRGNLSENQVLLRNNPQYQATLMLLPPKLRKAFMDGDYDVMEGQYFDTWNGLQHVIRPFEISPEFKIYMSMDWGYTKPLSIHWWAVAPDMRHVYCIREYYVTGKLSPTAAAEVHQINKDIYGSRYITERAVECMYADPSIFAHKGQVGKSIAEDFEDVMFELDDQGRKRKLMIVPADNDRVPGWNVFRNMLATQSDGLPFCQWFSTCENAIRTIPEMIHDEHRPEDLDTDGEDHAADDHRYFFIERFGPKKLPEVKPYDHLWKTSPESAREWANVEKNIWKREKESVANKVMQVGV